MPFHADYACLSKNCATGSCEAPTYELPTGSTRCPKCGSKRIRQLFNNPHVIARGAAPDPDMRLTSSSHLVRSTALLQPEADHADAYRLGDPKMRSWGVNPAQTAAVVMDPGGSVGKARPMQHKEIAPILQRDIRQYGVPVAAPSVLSVLNRQPIPTSARRDPRDG